MVLVVRSLVLSTAVMLCVLGSTGAEASSKNPGKVIAGWVEKVLLPEIGDEVLKAKLDTGAKTSSLHAINVETFKRDGKKWVAFDFSDGEGHLVHLEKPRVRGVKIKDLDGGYDRRSVVMMDICFDGRLHRAQFTLSDRKNLIYPILLGRDFLEGIAVIDSEATFLTQASCGNIKLLPTDKADTKP